MCMCIQVCVSDGVKKKKRIMRMLQDLDLT